MKNLWTILKKILKQKEEMEKNAYCVLREKLIKNSSSPNISDNKSQRRAKKYFRET